MMSLKYLYEYADTLLIGSHYNLFNYSTIEIFKTLHNFQTSENYVIIM